MKIPQAAVNDLTDDDAHHDCSAQESYASSSPKVQEFFDTYNFSVFNKRKLFLDIKKRMAANENADQAFEKAMKEQMDLIDSIRFIRFETLKELREIPRLGSDPDKSEESRSLNAPRSPHAPALSSTQHHQTVNLQDIDIHKAFIVFVSHCWLNGWDGKKDGKVVDTEANANFEQRGYPHPDNMNNDKHRLIIQGIESLIKNMIGSDDIQVYVWIDFGCIDQDENPAGHKQLDKIIEVSNCIFTPIVDPDHEDWKLPMGDFDWFDDYAAKKFNDGPYAYLHRAWCRVEMLYARHIDVRADVKEMAFRGGLMNAIHRGYRPHYVYGEKQYCEVGHGIPYQLSPLSNSHLDKFSPEKAIANLTKEADAEKIRSLMIDLEPFIKRVKVGYEGERNEDGNKHGTGKYTYDSGDVYDGGWKDGNKHGTGKYTYSNGTVYDGDWKDGNKHGTGKITYASGDVYDGDWKDNYMCGTGKCTYASGSVYEGGWRDDKKHGMGKRTYDSGDVYEGSWKDNHMHGRGKYIYANDDVYDGDWKDGNRHGTGYHTFANGDVYDGDWKDDKMQK